MQGILPIQAQPHGRGRGPITEIRQPLEGQHEEQIDGLDAGCTFGMLAVGQGGVVIRGRQVIADQAIGASGRQQSDTKLGQIVRHGPGWLGFERHGQPRLCAWTTTIVDGHSMPHLNQVSQQYL